MPTVQHPQPSRRNLLVGAGAVAALHASGAEPAMAAAPPVGSQVPSWYRLKVGAYEATIVSDGPLPLGPPTEAFKGASREDLERDLRDAYLPTDAVVLEQNALILNTGRQLLLFDTGMGASKLFGPTTGALLSNMRLAGIDPGQIDGVIISHAHSDHCFGLVGDGDRPAFPNARVVLTQSDYDFWTDEAKLGGPMNDFIAGARRTLVPLRDRITFVRDGQEAAPGVMAVASPGHTVGHTCYVIGSGRDALMFTGDIAHHQVLLLKRPRLEFAYDTDPALAARSRMRVLDMLATDRMPFVSYHFPFPGIGHVAKAGEGYAWYPTPMQMRL